MKWSECEHSNLTFNMQLPRPHFTLSHFLLRNKYSGQILDKWATQIFSALYWFVPLSRINLSAALKCIFKKKKLPDGWRVVSAFQSEALSQQHVLLFSSGNLSGCKISQKCRLVFQDADRVPEQVFTFPAPSREIWICFIFFPQSLKIKK